MLRNLFASVVQFFLMFVPLGYLDYVFFSRNHIMQCCYVLLIGFGYVSYTLTAYQDAYLTQLGISKIPFLMLGINLIFFFASSWFDPGVITKKNVKKHMKHFSYDDQMYPKKDDCVTCETPKPARSKHCSVCDRCVARFDHHCSWVNNCIGYQNYKFFILFLVSLVLMTLTGALAVLLLFLHIVEKLKLQEQLFTDDTGRVFKATFSVILSFLVGEYRLMSFLLLYLTMLFIALTCFLLFHSYIVFTNFTTNEIFKLFRLRYGKESNICGRDNNVKGYVKKPASLVYSFYSKGFFRNICEVFFNTH